jgi:hypothetical protein
MADSCLKCRIVLLNASLLQECAHCGDTYCGRHMVEHDRDLKMTHVTIPHMVGKH